jgi:hypothetical protein
MVAPVSLKFSIETRATLDARFGEYPLRLSVVKQRGSA